jgi:hypothetical protein
VDREESLPFHFSVQSFFCLIRFSFFSMVLDIEIILETKKEENRIILTLFVSSNRKLMNNDLITNSIFAN